MSTENLSEEDLKFDPLYETVTVYENTTFTNVEKTGEDDFENPIYAEVNRNKAERNTVDAATHCTKDPVYENVEQEIQETVETGNGGNPIYENVIKTGEHQIKELMTETIENVESCVYENVIKNDESYVYEHVITEANEHQIQDSLPGNDGNDENPVYENLASTTDYRKIIRMGLCQTNSQNGLHQ